MNSTLNNLLNQNIGLVCYNLQEVNITNLKYSEISDIETKNSQSEIYPLIIYLNHTNKKQLSWNTKYNWENLQLYPSNILLPLVRNYKLQNINQNENTNI